MPETAGAEPGAAETATVAAGTGLEPNEGEQ